MDSQQLALDCIVATLFDGSNEFAGGSSEVHYALRGIFEGILQHISHSQGFVYYVWACIILILGIVLLMAQDCFSSFSL